MIFMKPLRKTTLILVPMILFGIPIMSIMLQQVQPLAIAESVQPTQPDAKKPEIKEAKFITPAKEVVASKEVPTKKTEKAVQKPKPLIKGDKVKISRIDYGNDPMKSIKWLVARGAHVVHIQQGNKVKSIYNFKRNRLEAPPKGFQVKNKISRDITVEAAKFTNKKSMFLIIDHKLWSRMLAGYADHRSSTNLKVRIKRQDMIITDTVSNKTWSVLRG